MKLTALIHTHGKLKETLDTIDSIKTYMTKDILLLVDGAGWNQYANESISVPVLKGFNHGYHKAPYRNVILGLIHLYKNWPNSEWYFYTEYDALIGSSDFIKDLNKAADNGVWIIGNDYRDKQDYQGARSVKLTLLESILKEKFNEIYYLLGAVLFYHKDFMKKLMENEFLEKLLYYTNDFQNGYFPEYTDTSPAAWDVLEHMMPTLAKHWGGNIGQFAQWNDKKFSWNGNYKKYPIRWQPDLHCDEEWLSASIMHPIKTYDHPARAYHRMKRKDK